MRFGFVSSRILEALEQAAEPAQGKKARIDRGDRHRGKSQEKVL
jgi:hypothetical protein